MLASAVMAGVYVRGGPAWVLGFVFLVPWLRTLDASATLGAVMWRAYAMSVAYTAAAFAWFGTALGLYAQIGEWTGIALLLLGAPLFQPQFFAFALVRHITRQRHGVLLAALAGAAAWVAAEWLLPRLLGDSPGYGLYPSRLLRQGAAIGGAAGLTLLLLLANEAVGVAITRREDGVRALAMPLALAAAMPLMLALYGAAVLSGTPAPGGKPLRMGLIQSNIVAYDRQRQEKGTYAVVREVLDTHFAMSYDAIVRQHADAVLWSETAYPTTFGHPKSEGGAEFDREILATVKAAGVPFVFGTYDSDSAGEYNAAAFVQPDTGLLGFYRKTRLFPLTEYVPAWMDSPLVRRALPWSGSWRAGNGARVFPLRLSDGREIPVLPLICRDDVDPNLAVAGARLGAQAILTMSNDSWFSANPLGARMHQAVAAFRSIETRLPQFRVTTNGYSAVIDASGRVLAGTQMGERTLVIADVPVRTPPRTLMVLWGDWVGRAACAFLIVLALWSFLPALRPVRAGASGTHPAPALPATVAVLSPVARVGAAMLRIVARAGLLWIGIALLRDEGLRTNTLAQIRMFGAFFLLPEAAAWCLMFLFSAKATIADGKLLLARGAQRIEFALSDIVGVQLWRFALPCPGLWLQLADGTRWRYGLAMARPGALAGLLIAPAATPSRPGALLHTYAQAALALPRSRLDHPLAKYLLLPLALAIPAFHLQQQIAYGGAFGEYYSFGLKAYLSAFALWWAAWSIGVVLSEALLRAGITVATLLAALVQPSRTGAIRLSLERAGHAALFIGLPAWLFLTVYSG
ncbi:MAG TPA: apolipoprotein N-acyltransferase [Telluria sp.]